MDLKLKFESSQTLQACVDMYLDIDPMDEKEVTEMTCVVANALFALICRLKTKNEERAGIMSNISDQLIAKLEKMERKAQEQARKALPSDQKKEESGGSS